MTELGENRPSDSQRLYEQKWCPGPAISRGHKLPCSLLDQHEGPCIAPEKAAKVHRFGGTKACERNGCRVAEFGRNSPSQKLHSL